MTMILQQLGVWSLGGTTVLTVHLETVDGSLVPLDRFNRSPPRSVPHFSDADFS